MFSDKIGSEASHTRHRPIWQSCELQAIPFGIPCRLQDGDIIVVDPAIRQFNRDGLYIIRYQDHDEVMVKRLIRQPISKLLIIKSDNPNYPPHTSNLHDNDLNIEGRVIWLSRGIP